MSETTITVRTFRMEYRPDFRHRDGYEDFMLCAKCANEVFGQLDGMEDA